MKRSYPSYYKEFRCIAGDCPDSCCHEWEVQVDPDSAQRWRTLPGPLGDVLREYLYEEDGETYLCNEGDRCPMWRKDGLCRIQAELGHDALCQVCQQFPRLRHDYGDFEELGLEMSCPEAARLMLSTEASVWCHEEVPGGEEPEYDARDMAFLKDTRAEALAIVSDPSLSVGEALAVLLFYSHAAQELLDAGEGYDFDPEAALADARQFAEAGDFPGLVAFYENLEILTDRWRELLETGGVKRPWQEEDRRFARYLVERYWLQAISDFDIVSRAKLVVVSCIMVRHLGGDPVETAQIYSKEIENNSENVETLLEWAFKARSMTDRNLLGLLLN